MNNNTKEVFAQMENVEVDGEIKGKEVLLEIL